MPALVLVAFGSTAYTIDGFRPSAHGLLHKFAMVRTMSSSALTIHHQVTAVLMPYWFTGRTPYCCTTRMLTLQ